MKINFLAERSGLYLAEAWLLFLVVVLVVNQTYLSRHDVHGNNKISTLFSVDDT